MPAPPSKYQQFKTYIVNKMLMLYIFNSRINRVPITLRDLFWQDPFFSSNWDEFHKLHDEMMRETRQVWQRFDEQLKHLETGHQTPITPIPMEGNLGQPEGWFFPRKLMRLPSLFNDESTKDLFHKGDNQQIKIKNDEGGFDVSLDTSGYRPDEIKVGVENNTLTVEANHDEKAEDGSKHVVRRFTRKYTLPTGCKPETVTSNLSADGVLMITAPKLAIEDKRNVPIEQK